MFDNDYKLQSGEKGVIVSVHCAKLESHSTHEKVDTSINELKDLMRTLDIEYKNSFVQNKNKLMLRKMTSHY